MSALWRVISLLFVALFVVSVVIQLRTWRRQRRVRPVLIAVSQVAALASSIGFSVLTRRPPEADAWVALLGVGVFGGWVYGGLMDVDRNERGVVMSYSFPAIVTWAALMTITQLSAILSKSVPLVIYSIAIANLGVNLGMNGRVLSGYSRLRGAPAVGGLVLLSFLILSGIPTVEAQVLPPSGCAEGESIAVVDAAGNQVPLGTPGSVLRCLPVADPGPSQPTDPATDYSGIYRASFESANPNTGQLIVVPIEVRVVAAEGFTATIEYSWEGYDEAAGTLAAHYRYFASNDQPVVDGFLRARGVFFIEASISGGTAEGPRSMSPNAPATFTAQIAPDGSLSGTFEIDGGGTFPVTGGAVSGGPAAVPGESGASPPAVPGSPPGTLPVGPTTPPTSEVPTGPLSAEDAAAATALSAFLLAGGSLAQLLPLLQGGMSLTDALRSVGPPSGSTDALSGLPVLEDGRVMFQPPWEEGGPVPMDRDWVLEVMERQRRGERWMGEASGWMTDERLAENARWDAANREAVARETARFVAGQQAARAELARSREALEYLEKAREAAVRHQPAQFDAVLDRISAAAYRPDGSVNVAYVNELRGVMGQMLRREMQFPEESLRGNWAVDWAEKTWDGTRHSALIRIGTGVLSGGTSEVFYQGQAVWDGVGRASEAKDGSLTLADGLRAGYWAAADENLPVTTIAKVYNGEEVGILDVVGDVLKGVNVRNQAKATYAEHVADADGLFAWQRRELQAAATRGEVNVRPMQVNAAGKFRLFSGRGEYVGKPSWMKQKSINADDVRYLGYSKNQIGAVPGPPKPPSGFTNAAEYQAAKSHYQRRVAEWNASGGATKAKLASGELVEVDGVLHTVENGKPAKPFVSDIEPADIVDARTGLRVDDARAVRFQDELMERGLEAGNHGSPYTFDPRTVLKDDLPLDRLQRIERVPGPGGAPRWQLDGRDLPRDLAAKVQKADDLKASLIEKVEAGEAGQWIFAGGNAGSRPRWDSTGAALIDFQERGI